MNKRLFILLLSGLFAVLSLAACSDDDGLDPSSAEPAIAYPYDKLVADLNMADNLPVVAVVKSEAGLQRVSLSIRTAENELVAVKEVTSFFNPLSYSLSEKVNYKSGYTAAVVEAVDRLGRRVETTLPIEIIDVVEPPAIVFTPESWSYDETVGGEMDRTHFVVSSSATLRSVETFRVKTSGQEDFSKVEFTDEDPQNTYTFDELIRYGEFDKGFKVKATDSYGQVRIATLAVKYKTVPPPSVTFADATIFADKDEQKAVNIAIESQAGVVKVELFRLEGKTESLESTTTYDDRPRTLDYSEPMTFTNATSGVKVVVTDNVGRTTAASTAACVNMYYTLAIPVGTAPVADGYQGSNRLLSLGDQKTYSVEECFSNPELQTHADVKVYYMNGSSAIRIYSMENVDSKNKEYTANGQNVGSFSPINATRFKKLSGVDFDAMTAADIAAIDPASIQSSSIKDTKQDELVGAVIAFKTASTSSAGAGKVGLLKLVSVSEKIGTNANARVFTFAIKLPKEQ